MVKGCLSKLSQLLLFTGYSGLIILIRSVNCLVAFLWGTPSWKRLQNQNEMMPKCYSDILAISIKNLFSSVSLVRLVKTKTPIQLHVMFLWRIYNETNIVVTLFSIVSISLTFLFWHFKVIKLHFCLVDFGFRVL